MKPYPSYKESRVEWIGEFPTHWTNTRIKSVVESVVNGVWGDDPQENENDMICVRVADFDMQKLGVGKEKLTTRNIPENQQGERLLVRDNLLIEKSGGGETQPVGRAIKFDLDEKAVCSNFIGKISVNKSKAFPSFLLYYLSNLYSKAINTRSIKQTTGIQNLDTYSYFSERISLPPLHEQQAIADYLDCKTAQIDTLIEKKQRQIDMLQEQRMALINHAVTMRLNSNAQMKDSKLWFGKIPSHWNLSPLKYLTTNIVDCLHDTPIYSDDGDYPAIRTADIVPGSVDIKNAKRIDEEQYLIWTSRLVPAEGDILYTREGERFGLAALVPPDTQLCISQRMMLFRIKPDHHSAYFMWQLNSQPVYQQAVQDVIGATSPHINIKNIRNFIMVVPPTDEQVSISNYISDCSVPINESIFRLNKEILLLQEYRTALISEAVTGKIDVR
jgi:type I restriction enzyme, S subunit